MSNLDIGARVKDNEMRLNNHDQRQQEIADNKELTAEE